MEYDSIYINKSACSIHEIRHYPTPKNLTGNIEVPEVRIFACMYGHCAIQIRNRGPATESQKGTPRNMIATAQLNHDQLIRLQAAITAYLEQGESP